MKRKLIEEAGKKCANPGCSEGRVHIHHIEDWAVYETHDQRHMIALCPTCHDAVHHGSLEISDEELHAWKALERSTDKVRTAVYVEPGDGVLLHAGQLSFTGERGAILIDLEGGSRLSFRIVDGAITVLELLVCGADGQEIVRVRENHLEHCRHGSIEYQARPGHIVLTAPTELLLPEWALRLLGEHDPFFTSVKWLAALSLRVEAPGVVRVEGVWLSDDVAVVITSVHLALAFRKRGFATQLGAYGEGKPPIIRYQGSVLAPILDPDKFGSAKRE